MMRQVDCLSQYIDHNDRLLTGHRLANGVETPAMSARDMNHVHTCLYICDMNHVRTCLYIPKVLCEFDIKIFTEIQPWQYTKLGKNLFEKLHSNILAIKSGNFVVNSCILGRANDSILNLPD